MKMPDVCVISVCQAFVPSSCLSQVQVCNVNFDSVFTPEDIERQLISTVNSITLSMCASISSVFS